MPSNVAEEVGGGEGPGCPARQGHRGQAKEAAGPFGDFAAEAGRRGHIAGQIPMVLVMFAVKSESSRPRRIGNEIGLPPPATPLKMPAPNPPR